MTIPLPLGTENPNLRALSRHIRETRTGSTSTTWDLTNVVVDGHELIYKNGLLLEPGTGLDYLVNGRRITLAVAPIAGDRLTASYWYRVS